MHYAPATCRNAARWASALVAATAASALVAVDMRWHQDYQIYDFRSKTGFTAWNQSSCDSAAAAATVSINSMFTNHVGDESRSSTLSCLKSTRNSSCLPGSVCSADSSNESACTACRRDYFDNPPPKDELRRHYRFILDATARWRGIQQHAYGSHSGPWLENHFMRNFFWRGFDYWYPLVPLFVQATDALFLGKAVATAKSLETFFSGSPAGSANQHDASAGSGRLRDDVIYVLVIQHDMGALAVVPDPHVWRNTLVLSAGGWGNVPLPLMTAGGCMQASPDQWARAAGAGSAAAAASNSLWESAIVRSHLLSFVGRVSYRDVSKAGGISDRIVDWRQDLMYNLAAALCFAEDAQQSVAASADGAAQPTPSELSGSADHRIGFTDEELVALGSDWLASSKRPTPPSTAPQLLSHEDLARLGLSSTEGDAGLDAGTNVHARKTTPRIRCGLHLQQWRRNDAWRRVTAESALVLATRGVGATSFRLYESLAAGRVPVYVWQDLLWLPYARAAETLWGPNGVAIVAEGTSAPAVLTSSVPELLRHRSATEVRGRPDAAAAIERGNAGAGQLSGGSFGTASDAGASTATSIESLVLQAAAQGRATKQHVPSARSALTSPTAPQTTGDDLAYAVPSTSHLAEMEARLRRLHDRYFTYDALMVHIDAFLRRPDASELHCEAKPYVMFTP